MSSGCGDVLSLQDLKTAKLHQTFEAEVITGLSGGVAGGASIDYATNLVTSQIQKTMPAILRDIGFRPASFTFTTGGTLNVGDSDVAVLWPISSGGDGAYYIWKGAYPKVIPASSTPATTGGVSSSGWLPYGDVTLRSDLASSSTGKGASIVGFRQSASDGFGARTVQDKLGDTKSVKDFLAVGDGVTDDTAALTAALTWAGKGNTVTFPDGVYIFTAAMNIPITNGFYIKASEVGSVTLRYTGANATNDLITIGSTTTEVFNIGITNIVIDSTTDMTAGYALRLNKCSRVRFNGVCMDRTNGTRKLNNGIWFNDLQQGWMNNYELYVKGTGVTVNGRASTDSLPQHGADLWVRSGMAVSCTVAFNVAGGFGGFYIDEAVNFGCGTSVLVDNSKQTNGNRELFFGGMFVSDGAFEAGIHLNDTYSNNSPVNIGGFIASSGTFGGTNKRAIYVQAYAASRISICGAQIFNCQGDAVVIQDPTALVSIDSSTFINLNVGHGVYSPIPNGNIDSYAVVYNNTAGDYLNVGGNGVWQSFSGSAPYAGSGSITALTSSFRFKIDKRTIHFKCEIGVSNNGTGASALWFKLPRQPAGNVTIYGNNLTTGKALTGYGNSGSDIKITNYDATYPVASSQTVVVQGHYEF